MITCKLTGDTGKPIKAHIIPRAFYELPSQKEGSGKLVGNGSHIFPKKLPIGIYDSTIVTQKGENIFEAWDNYATQLLLNDKIVFDEIKKQDQLIGWQLANYNYSLLKLFSLSILWRAHASSHNVFKKVKLGPHEAKIRKLLLTNDADVPDQYSVIIYKWIDDGFGPVIMDPFREKYDGVNFYRFYCGRYIFFIKVDSLRTTGAFRYTQLTPKKNLIIIARNLKNSKEFPLMQKIAMENSRHAPFKK
ncbi:MAG: hypothetical protein GY730_00995 [bacterium]|nr:hypothetical protein [bacterium]